MKLDKLLYGLESPTLVCIVPPDKFLEECNIVEWHIYPDLSKYIKMDIKKYSLHTTKDNKPYLRIFVK